MNTTKQIVLSAMLAALLLSGQVVLGFIPNVEIVTLIIIVSAFVFPPRVIITAALVFCTGQWLIYGFGYWVIAYYIYWPLLGTASLSLKLIKRDWLKNLIAVAIAGICTFLFGILTTFIDVVFMSDSINFFTAFGIIYLRGIYFCITHIVSNCVIVGLMFTPLSIVCKHAVKPKTIANR